MPLITEFRILMPLTVEEYEIGQRYTASAASLAETGGGEGIEVRQNRPFANYPLMNGRYTSGQYTQKLYHLKSKVPAYVKMLAPTGSLTCLEESWNCFPYCRTILTNPGYMKDDMQLCVETMHLQDNGTTQNALQLSQDELSKRKVVYLNIADEGNLKPEDKVATHDPTKFVSTKTGRGPLKPNWAETADPIMCCYKLVRVKFHMKLIGGTVENKLMNVYPRVFTKINRETWTLQDWWHGFDKAQLIQYETTVKAQLDNARNTGPVKGMKPS